jgi:hypothetical protein
MNDVTRLLDAIQHGEAFKMGDEGLALLRKVNGPEHPDTLKSIEWVAHLHEAAGRKDEAAKLRAELEALKAKH